MTDTIRISPLTLVGLGELLWDRYPTEKFLGGAPANVAVHAANLGEQGVVVSRVGADVAGAEAIEALDRRGIDTHLIQQDAHKATGEVLVALGPDSVPRFTCVGDVAYDQMVRDDRWPAFATGVDGIVFGTLAQRAPASRAVIRWFVDTAGRALKVYDANLRGWRPDALETVRASLALADIGKFSEEEFRQIRQGMDATTVPPRVFGRRLVEDFQLRLVAVSLGPWGCWVCGPESDVYAPAVAVTPVDTTGAGDAFVAALMVRLLRGGSLPEVAAQANLVGAYTATQRGATPVYGPEDLRSFAAQHTAVRAHPRWEDLLTG